MVKRKCRTRVCEQEVRRERTVQAATTTVQQEYKKLNSLTKKCSLYLSYDSVSVYISSITYPPPPRGPLYQL